MSTAEYNRDAWNKAVAGGNKWSLPANEETIALARDDNWRIVLTPTKPVPRAWFPLLKNADVLCLASGGGQQGPILSAAGANVTIFDNSPAMLEQDRMVAKREGLDLKTVQGDMRDLSCFADESFDLIVHPVSNCFVESVLPVWKEAFRVCRKNGALLSGMRNPIAYMFDLKSWEEDKLVLRHSIPYSDLTDLPDEERQELLLDKMEPLCFGHTLNDQIQGQIAEGFLLAGFYEDSNGGDEPLDRYIDSFIATRAVKQ